MLSLSDLRTACIYSLCMKPTVRTLLLASLTYDKDEISEILNNVEFSIVHFKKIVESSQDEEPAEERLLIETIKHVKNPSVGDLLIRLCESDLKLRTVLENEGLDSESLRKNLVERLAKKNKSILDGIVPSNSNTLIHFAKSRLN